MITINIKSRDSAQDLKYALTKSHDAAQKNRIRAIINIKEGATKTATAKRFVVSRTSVVSWVKAYNTGGVKALETNKGGRPGGNPKWDTSLFEDLAREIDKGGYWSIPKMQEWLQKNHCKYIPEQTIWYRMNQLSYSCKSSRPHPVQANKEKQESFKKGAFSRSWSR